MVATLLLSGLRIDEACSLLVGGVRRAEHILHIPDAKTPARSGGAGRGNW